MIIKLLRDKINIFYLLSEKDESELILGRLNENFEK